ncbi:hypothetical protein BLS_002675 [Venturia inaequalis]|uniref:uracil phosphoribosyltransferase n=1 Tax=Venturia inaequalis TaxID=5025 RepID=A0A8H3YUI0_VENIN|nr:hypothetical protein EG327_010284 [Venturia inaequalis]KAE9975305.1 hypothetical protein BLS_002675 [Venturia inaequalis]KAE9977285.1 hypothetical protein EG328_002114 [Venturia inaequalis]RDI88346.1 hypothetical protein Vi05172_g2184 [Venturia inaequalis]
MASLPANAHVSTHPCVQAKLSQLRSKSTQAREVKSLINEIATIVGVEALGACLKTVQSGTESSPLNYEYPVHTLTTPKISLIPILRSGLSMIDALSSILPLPVPVHHLGMYREKSTLQPVEYYNNLPYHKRGVTDSQEAGPSEIAIVVDPVIATGATAMAAVETLRDWGVKRVIVVAILGSADGLRRVAESWPEAVEIYVGGCDAETDERGMIKPGLGDIGDRIFLTVGK